MSKSTGEPKKRALHKKEDKRLENFKLLHKLLSACIPPLVPLTNTDGRFELVTPRPFRHKGVEKPNGYFGAIIIQKDYVGLYLMFIYDEPANLALLGPDLEKTLKGKSCFHIKKLDKNLIAQVEQAVKDGLEYYREQGAI